MLTYAEALQAASQGRIDDPAVLAAFEAEVAEAERLEQLPRQISSMANLAALLLDLGNRSPTPDKWNARYEECIRVSEKALKLNPTSAEALANRDAAKRNIKLRDPANQDTGGPPAPPSPPPSNSNKKRKSIFDDEDDDDEDDEEELVVVQKAKKKAPAKPASGKVPDPSARKPASWDEEEDGKWEPPLVDADSEDEDEDAQLLSASSMTYDEALRLASQRKVDKTVLAVMRREVEYAIDLSGPDRVVGLRANLGAALLDAANKSPDPAEFTRLYKEVESVSAAALAIDPNNDAAKTNMENARKNLGFRLGDAAGAGSPPAKPSGGGKSKALFDDDDDEDDAPRRASKKKKAAAKPAAGRGKKSVFDDDDDDAEEEEEWVGEDGVLPATAPQLSYSEALQRAQRRESDGSVLAAFRREHDEAERESGGKMTPRLLSIKTNLGALCVDMGNKSPDPNESMNMYTEAERVSQEILDAIPGEATAKSNLINARKNKRLQDPRLTIEPGPEGPFTLTRAMCEGLEVPPIDRTRKGREFWGKHFSGERSATVEAVQDALASELAECGPRVYTLVRAGDFVAKLADTDKDGSVTEAESTAFFGREGAEGLPAAIMAAKNKPADSTLMLVMVIKNEREHLERSLPKWAPLVDYWLIGVDDKNTDGSEEVIQKTLGHIPGEIYNVTFDGMGPALTQLVKRGLERYPNATHGVLADADFTPISTPLDWSKHELDLTTSKHSFTIWNEKGKEWRKMDWIYRNIPGVHVIRRTHQTVEVPSIPGQLRYTKEITFQVREYTGGYQDRSGNKQQTYIRWLEKDLEEMPGDGRTVYYLAVAHLLAFMSGPDPHGQVRDNGPNMKHALAALKYFRECATIESASSEQRYFALTEAAQLCERYLNRFKDAEEDYLKAGAMDPVRADAWHGVGELHRKQGQYSKAIPYLRKAAALVMPKRNFGQNEYLYTCQRHISLAKAVDKAKKPSPADVADARQSLLKARAKCTPDQQHEVESLLQSIAAKDAVVAGSKMRSEL